MANLSHLLTLSTQVRRLDDTLVDDDFPFSDLTSREHSTPVVLTMRLTGSVSSVPVYVVGSLNGVSQNESITVPTTGIERTTKTWDKIVAISSSYPGAGNITIKSTYPSGQKANIEALITTIKGRLFRSRFPRVSNEQGGPALDERWIFYSDSFNVIQGDILVINNVRYEVESVYPTHNSKEANHIQCWLKKLK